MTKGETAAAGGGGLSGVAIRRPVFTSMLMVGLVVLGLFSFRRLPIDQFPEVDIPVVTVQTLYPGAAPETVETEVTERLEEAFNPVEGVDRITSTSLESVSQIVIEFELGRRAEDAAQDVRAKIDTVRRELPDDIEPPIVETFDPAAQPILSLAVSSTSLSVPELTTLADDRIRRRLEAASGVGRVQLAGGLEREIRVSLHPDRMQALGVSAQDVLGALARQNLDVPAGRVEREARERLVRVVGRITDAEQFRDVVVGTRSGQPVRLAQVADVEVGTEEQRSLALVDGEPAVSLDVLKVSGANTVRVADAVKEEIAALRAMLPAGTELRVVRDNSQMIRDSVHDVIVELILGAILTVIVVMLFLNDVKATAITSLALPVSVVASFVLMAALGFTLNVLTLMALSLSIGILIDDAIVVIENIVRHRQMGKPAMVAAGEATSEIFLAVMATTLTIVAVFVPVAFMGGIVGRFFYQFGMTVAFAVLVSLLVSFTLTPMMSGHWGVEPHDPAHGGRGPRRLISAFNRLFDRGADRYRGIVGWALGHRKTVVAAAVLSLLGAFALFPFIGGAFLPQQDESAFAVQIKTPEGSSLAFTASKVRRVGEILRALPGVDFTYTTVGAGVTGTVTSGQVYVDLVPTGERDDSQQELMSRARAALRPLFGVTTAVLEAGGGPGGNQKPIQVNLRGPDIDRLRELSDTVAAAMRDIPGVVDVESSLEQARAEYRIEVNRDLASELGLDIGQVSATVRPLLAGETATTWRDPLGEERDVVIQVPPGQREDLASLTSLPIATLQRTGDGGAVTVPLGQIATIVEGEAPARIERYDLSRVGTVSAATTPDVSVAEASSAIRAAIARIGVPPGYTATLGGETEQLEETAGYVLEALLLAVILIFLILASQFESVAQPLAIMLSLPLSLVGVLLALLLSGDTLNMMSMIGVIMLMGLVTKNAILLVDNANERRRAGADRHDAVVEAGRVRLRPIVMTTAAMIFGMLPIALAIGEGGGFRAPMARAVIGGLITSTLLTLVVVPVAYTYFDDLGGLVGRLRGRRRAAQVPGPEPEARPATTAEIGR